MAGNTTIRIKRLDDAALFRIFKEAETAAHAALEAESENLRGHDHTISLTFRSFLPWEITEEDLRGTEPGQFVLGTVNLRFNVKITDGNQSKQSSLSFALTRGETDNLNDSITITCTDQFSGFKGEGEQAVQRAIQKALSPILQPVAPEDGGLVPALTNLSQAFDTTYQRITNELASAVSAVSDERTKQITEFQDERRRLQEEISEEREDLTRSIKEAKANQQRELAEERKELAEEWAKLETSSHKDARRKQFIELQEDLRTALSAPVADTGLRKMRWGVFAALLIAGFAAGYFAFLSFNVATWEATIPSSAVDRFSTTLMLVLRSVVLTVASLTAFFGAAAWMRYFYNRDLHAQEEMRRFQNDMARASWVMEASMEIRKEHGEEIPPEWISGVTQGLFGSAKNESFGEGAQALAALMGLSASANLGPNGMQFQLSKKGRKAIAEAAEEA